MSTDNSTLSLLPPDDDLDVIHTRQYESRIYRVNEKEMLVRGAISDMKPPGLYVPDDSQELEIHQMHISLNLRSLTREQHLKHTPIPHAQKLLTTTKNS